MTLFCRRCPPFFLWYGKRHQVSHSSSLWRRPRGRRGVRPAVWGAQPRSHLLLGLPQGRTEADAPLSCLISSTLHISECRIFAEWVSLLLAFVCSGQEIGIFLGLLVDKVLTESKPSECLLTKDDLRRAAKVFKDILLKCRHWVSFVKRHVVLS